MFFQISPVVNKKPKPKLHQKEVENEEPQIERLSLAPFTANPKIVFENIPIGTTHSRKLLISNPTSNDVHLTIFKKMHEDLNLAFNWTEVDIKQGAEVMLEMVWCPQEEIGCRQMFTLSDGKRIHRDIAVTFKSVAPKKDKVNGKQKLRSKAKSPLKVSLSRKPKSPVKKFKPTCKSSGNNQPLSPKICGTTPPSRYKQFHRENKENLNPINQSISSVNFVSPTNMTFVMDKAEDRRATYILKSSIEHKQNIIPFEDASDTKHTYTIEKDLSSSPNFRDSLDSPSNVLPLKEMNRTTSSGLIGVNNQCSPNFEYKLRVLESFSFSPAVSMFNPSITSSNRKPELTSNSSKTSTIVSDLFPMEHQSFYLNSNDTYNKGNISSETYTKENLSSGTYVKDSSLDNASQVDVSPLTSKERNNSLVFIKPPSFEFTNVQEEISVTDFRKQLSSIQEESLFFNESVMRSGKKRKSPSFYQPISPKRSHIVTKPILNWSKQGGVAYRMAKTTSGLNLTTNNETGNTPISTIQETTTRTVIVQNPFLFAHILDPFMTAQVYSTEEWLQEQEQNFKKCLNALLTPPKELLTKTENIDIARIWQECKKTEVMEAPTKEILSLNFHSNSKLDALRKQAQSFFRTKEMSVVLQKVCTAVEAGKLSIRSDKDVHLNLKLKADIIALILNYNPLWLRLGLETIYNEVLPLKSNSDTTGLVHFLMERFFKDPQLIKKHKSVYSPKYTSDLKKFMLKKFLILVYFLDKCKMQKLMQHDPCLFCKNASEKESRLLLINFARETLSAVGDITKYLKCLGYVVEHVQSYIHEFEYGVKNLGADLRDGVRLARVMEIIQMRDDLTEKLRVPAISRLQKVHNMQLVFQSLTENGYEIQHDISPKDIVDGHREKTLSFLWQIIYKFEAPLMTKSATTIQTWFRSLPITLKRMKLKRIHQRKEEAAKRIQKWYARQKLSKILFQFSELARVIVEDRKRIRAAVKIQSFYRQVICRRKFLKMYNSVVSLQALAKGWLIRHNYRRRIVAACTIQKFYRMYVVRKRFLKLKKSTLFVQNIYRARKIRSDYITLKNSVISVQTRYRAKLTMRLQRNAYLQQKYACIIIQSFFRAYIARRNYVRLRSAICIQRRYRAFKLMQTQRLYFEQVKNAIIVVQRRFRANLLMKQHMKTYSVIRRSAIVIQSYYRGYRARRAYIELRHSVIIIQNRYRALMNMKRERLVYKRLQESAVMIQHRWRANRLGKTQRKKYLDMKQSAIIIQRRYRGYRARKAYLKLRHSVIIIQRRYRALITMKSERLMYKQLQENAIIIQQRWRAHRLGKTQRKKYLDMKQSAITIQRRYRGYRARKAYLKLRHSVIIIQRRYRALMTMKSERLVYKRLQESAIIIQQRWRAHWLGKTQRKTFLEIKQSAIIIQRRVKANALMKTHRKNYLVLKEATIKIQIWYRSILVMRACKNHYAALKIAVSTIEIRYASFKSMQVQRTRYLALKEATITLQRRYRALDQMRRCRLRFLELKSAAIVIQCRYRALITMRQTKSQYRMIKKAAATIQNRFRANKIMIKLRDDYSIKKRSVVTIQKWFRSIMETRRLRLRFEAIRRAAIVIQQRFRAKVSMRIQYDNYTQLRNATIMLQRRYRARLQMKMCRDEYSKLKRAAVAIQRRFRANKLGRMERKAYEELKNACVVIQRWHRARRTRINFMVLRSTVVYVQTKFRAKLLMLQQRAAYLDYIKPEAVEARRIARIQNAAAVKIQALWKGYCQRKSNTREMVAIRQRKEKIGQLQKSVERSKTLAERCEMAMMCMTNENSTLLQVLRALEDLDFITRHSRVSCIKMSLILPDQLYIIITSAARSLPEMSACNLATYILINFYKYPETRARSWVPEYIDQLINVMLHWCDKDEPLFSTLCTLFWLFGHEEEWKKVILGLPNIKHRLHKMSALVQRKQNMVAKKKNCGSNSYFGSICNVTLPTCTANWGLDYDRPNKFTNSVHALNNLLGILNS